MPSLCPHATLPCSSGIGVGGVGVLGGAGIGRLLEAIVSGSISNNFGVSSRTRFVNWLRKTSLSHQLCAIVRTKRFVIRHGVLLM